MAMDSTFSGQRVWIAILPPRDPNDTSPRRGTKPDAYALGIVRDPTPQERHIVSKGGRTVQNAVMAYSYNELPDGRKFHKYQAQGLIGLEPRTDYDPDIDGPIDQPANADWFAELDRLVSKSQDGLIGHNPDALAAAQAKSRAKTQAPAENRELVTA